MHFGATDKAIRHVARPAARCRDWRTRELIERSSSLEWFWVVPLAGCVCLPRRKRSEIIANLICGERRPLLGPAYIEPNSTHGFFIRGAAGLSDGLSAYSQACFCRDTINDVGLVTAEGDLVKTDGG